MANINNVKDIKIPKESVELAEFIGIILGDGCISRYYKPGKCAYAAVRIAGHAEKDYDYLVNYVKPLIEKLFDIKVSVKRHSDLNKKTIYLIIYGIKLIDFLKEMGLKSGNKIQNQTTIPKWIFSDDEYLKACVRGLYDTDGSLYELLPHWPGLFQLNFDNYNITLLKDMRKALIQLDFHPSKIHGTKTKNGTKVDITRKAEIKKFYKEIGTSNLRRIKQFNKIT